MHRSIAGEEMRTYVYKNTQTRQIYHPRFKLIRIEGLPLPFSPKVGDLGDQWTFETLVYNGERVILEPNDE
jgi:hypothetical protein